MHLCFRKATSVKEEEISKAKKSRRAISLDSGKEIMSTYWGYFFTWKVMWKLSSRELWLCLFCIYIFLIFIGWTVLLTGSKGWKYEFGLIFLWFYLSSKCDCLEFHVDVKTFWILFMMNKMAKYFYVTEFYTRVLADSAYWWSGGAG